MLHLPVELVLNILSYLDISDIVKFSSLSKAHHSFVDSYEDSIYHRAAYHHEWIPNPSMLYEEAKEVWPKLSLYGMEVDGWKSLCARGWAIEKAWTGNGANRAAAHLSTNFEVHRIKADEREGIIIVTTQDGNLYVVDFRSSVEHILWALPDEYVRAFAHCEYSNGYLVFDRFNGQREVWRLTLHCNNDPSPPTVVPESKPDVEQLEAHAESLEAYPIISKGHFTPWALLSMNRDGRAYRFVYPTLLVTSNNEAYLFDVPTGRKLKTIENIQAHPTNHQLDLGQLYYVEQSPRHIFACGTHGLRVWEKESGKCVLDISSSQAIYGEWMYVMSEIEPDKAPGRRNWKETRQLVEYPVKALHKSERREYVLHDRFLAAHVSSDGKHLVILTVTAKLIIISDFEATIPNSNGTQDSLESHTVEVQLGSPTWGARYLAFEHGRIAAATDSGIYVVHPTFGYSFTTSSSGNASSDSASVPATITGEADFETQQFILLQGTLPTGARIPGANVPSLTNTGSTESTSSVPPLSPLSRPAPPLLRLARLPWFNDPAVLSCISCLQMTETALLFNWNFLNEETRVHVYDAEGVFLDELKMYNAALKETDGLSRLLNIHQIIPEGLTPSSAVCSINFVAREGDSDRSMAEVLRRLTMNGPFGAPIQFHANFDDDDDEEIEDEEEFDGYYGGGMDWEGADDFEPYNSEEEGDYEPPPDVPSGWLPPGMIWDEDEDGDPEFDEAAGWVD